MSGKPIDVNNINRDPFDKKPGDDHAIQVLESAQQAEKRIEAKYSDFSGGLGALIERRGGIVGELGAERIYQNGVIIDNGTEAHVVYGGIYQKYHALGLETSFLGGPQTDEMGTPDGVGRFNHFQGGSIYWTPNPGAFEVHGAIRDKWASLGWERSYLGYPLTDETAAPDDIGRYNNFQGGIIYWTPAGGAIELQNTRTWDSGPIAFSDSTALGGYCKLVMNRNGDWTFSGHMHDSGADTYSFGIAAVAFTPSGIGYTLQVDGRAEGTSAGLPFGTPNRDFDWTNSGNNPSVRDNWMQAAQATFKVRVVAQDKLAGGLSDVVQDALKELVKAGVTALIALL